MQKILVTGASGFLGTNLVSKLSKNKKIVVYGLVNKKRKKFSKIKNVNYIKVDITNIKELKKKINLNFDYVINLAGNINHKNKRQTYNSHYKGVQNLIKIIKKRSIIYSKAMYKINCDNLSKNQIAKDIMDFYENT